MVIYSKKIENKIIWQNFFLIFLNKFRIFLMFYKKSQLNEFEILHPRSETPTIAEETIKVCKEGFYTNKKGEKIEIKEMIDQCINHTKTYKYNYKYNILKHSAQKKGEIEISLETTNGAGYRLVVQEGIQKTVALNFANATDPGGNWKHAQAQEETIVRSSALLLSITHDLEMYEYNIQDQHDFLYSDYQILSKDCPVFRDDQLEFLDQPFKLSFITSPAVMAIFFLKRGGKPKKIEETMKQRIKKIIYAAIEEGYDALILGAFGCGAFGNDPKLISQLFKHYLVNKGLRYHFDKVVFPIFDTNAKKTKVEDFCNAFDIHKLTNFD
ncbi:hypothetical protein TRFO_21114 [Tritrichomonas foetus]|uniref:Microbial-type PARG catalytic domain-containing protein n=1 Tax=Tritrichomonas foetus TaxID=1144522 RepID=A0A1J4KEH9_9EUKA|nr:hypothetical protein TRFO_21114 [Tritrichomonas foetus]|eukprot:OHT09833.1 hypothetical protein TRFO_21114 [Tritrichomonas foetus]